MKEYIIWLDSGECVTGTVDEENESLIKEAFVKKAFGLMTFSDTEGTVYVAMSNMQAICFNNTQEGSKCGF